MSRSLGLTILLSVAGLAACGPPARAAPEVGDYAPPFVLTASDGTTVALSDVLRDGAALLYFNMAFG